MGFFRRNIEEIREDPVLRLYGVFLAGTHALTWVFWYLTQPARAILTDGDAICWGFWDGCGSVRPFTPASVEVAFWLYLVLTLACGALFLNRRWITWAWLLFLALNVLKLAIVVQDFRFRLNQHYMAGLVALAFLFVPDKRRFVRLLIVFFYVWAGLLKTNREWLSGAALYNPIWLFTGKLLPIACGYVVVLEILLVWGLFSRRTWLFAATLVQLALFHVFSWPVVGFFYPAIMFSLLAIFVLDRALPRVAAEPARWPGYAFLGLFSLAQRVPLVMPGDAALTGEGRIFTIHMFDARVVCEGEIHYRRRDGREGQSEMPAMGSVRIACDPLVWMHRARGFCNRRWKTGVADFDLTMRARKVTTDRLQTVIDIKDFCESGNSLFHHNDWIRAPE